MSLDLKDAVPPHNIDAEKATLGALLLDWSCTTDIIPLLRSEHFYSQQNALVYEAILRIYNASGTGDLVAVKNELLKMGKLSMAGGDEYIATLTNDVPSAANVEYYAQIVLDKASRRSLLKISSEVKSTAFDESRDSRSILDEAEKKIFDLSDIGRTITIHDMQEVVWSTTQIIERQYKDHSSFSGIASGFRDLDTMTSGFQNSELTIIGARPSMGKTALALSMMVTIAI